MQKDRRPREGRCYEICCCGVQWLGWPTTPVARPWVAGNGEENMEMRLIAETKKRVKHASKILYTVSRVRCSIV